MLTCKQTHTALPHVPVAAVALPHFSCLTITTTRPTTMGYGPVRYPPQAAYIPVRYRSVGSGDRDEGGRGACGCLRCTA
jgi:hypothetical protein